MKTATVVPKINADNVIQLKVVNGKLSEKQKIKYNKDGSIDKRHCNKVAGVSSEVYAFTSEEEIKSMVNVLDKHIEEAPDENKKQIAYRNKMLFLIGINVGLRASDLRSLQYNFFFKDNGEFKEFYTFQPKKQKKQGKFVKLYFNQTVKKAVTDYISKYPIEKMNNYLFQSRQGDKPITEAMLWKIIKDTAREAGIDKNIGSHSLRKTWGYHSWHNAKDKNKALVMLQQCFNHSSSLTTLRYIGVLDDEKKEMYESIELGLEFI